MSPSLKVTGQARVGHLVVQGVQGIVEIDGKSLENLDFSGAQLDEWRFTRCRLVNCRFDRARCRQWILRSSIVEDCTFGQADFSDAHSSEPVGRMRWNRVRFVRADMRRASFIGAELDSCDFAEARLKRAYFQQCRLTRCRFAGLVQEVVFDARVIPERPKPHEFEEVDFSNAHLQNVDFRGLTFEHAVLPDDADVFIVRRFPCFGPHALELLKRHESPAARIVEAVIQNELRGPTIRPDAAWLFNRRDWREWGGDECASLAEVVFKQAEALCVP